MDNNKITFGGFREKVMKGLSLCTNSDVEKYDDPNCYKCPYYPHVEEQECMDMLHADAMKLLKEQEPQKYGLVAILSTEKPTPDEVKKIMRQMCEELVNGLIEKDLIYHHLSEPMYSGDSYKLGMKICVSTPWKEIENDDE